MPYQLHGNQRAALGKQFSPPTAWVPGMALMLSSLRYKCLYHLSYLTSPYELLFEKAFFSLSLPEYTRDVCTLPIIWNMKRSLRGN